MDMAYPPRYHNPVDSGENEFDPTCYRGGYDIALTFGRPLRPSREICYPNSSSSPSNVNFDRPHYKSHCEPCAYKAEAIRTEYNSYTRPKPRPVPFPAPGYDLQQGRPNPQPDFGFRAGTGHGPDVPISGYGRPDEEYGLGGRRTEIESYGRPGYKELEEVEEMRRAAYGTPNYGRTEVEEHRRDNYGRPIHEEEHKRFQERSYEGESYGRHKYGDDSDDDEEKQHHRHQHHPHPHLHPHPNPQHLPQPPPQHQHHHHRKH